MQRWNNPLFEYDCIYKHSSLSKQEDSDLSIIHGFTRDVIKRRMQMKGNNNTSSSSRRMAFLDLLLNTRTEDGKSLTFVEVSDEVNTFMNAGYETTSGTVAWFLFIVGHHPDVQVSERSAGRDSSSWHSF